jgi:ATP-dependent Lon protease
VIECSGYVTSEKVAIAKRFLLPKQLRTNGMTSELVQLGDEALIRIATEYTREVCEL